MSKFIDYLEAIVLCLEAVGYSLIIYYLYLVLF